MRLWCCRPLIARKYVHALLPTGITATRTIVRSATTNNIPSSSGPNTSIPTPKGFFESLFEKPNVTLRSRIPLTEEQLQDMVKKPVLSSVDYYKRFTFSEVSTKFKANSETIQQVIDVDYDISHIELRELLSPRVGSVLEAALPNGDVAFGVVIQDLQGRFKESLNQLELFTIDGQFIKVRPSQVIFCISSFYKESVLRDILQRKDKMVLLQQVQYSLILFIHYAMELDQSLQNLNFYDALYLKLSSNSVMRACSNSMVFETMLRAKSLLTCRSYTNFALLFLGHYHIINSPQHFLFDLQEKSYFSIPRFTAESIKIVENLKDKDVKDFHDFILYMYEDMELSHHTGSNILNLIYHQKNNYSSIFRFLKYFIIYPHFFLQKHVKILLGQNSSIEKIISFMEGLHLFDHNKTDVLLSSELFGHEKSSISVSRQILPKDDHIFSDSNPSDHFQHLRKGTTLENTNTEVFGIPLDDQGSVSELAFSIVKKNSRDWIINFHIPDLGSCISPKSNENSFAKILKRPYCDDLTLANGNLNFLPGQFKKSLQFHNDNKLKNCFTVSFPFNRRDPNKSWSDLKPTVKPDIIKNIEILNSEEFEYAVANIGPISFSGKIRKDVDLSFISDLLTIMMSRRKYRKDCGSLDLDFPTQETKVEPNGDIKFESIRPNISRLFLEEIDLTIDTLVGSFCELNNIPAYYHSQKFLEKVNYDESDLDSVFDNPLTPYLPQYHVRYKDLLLQRSFGGSLTPTAYFVAKSFHQPEITTTKPDLSQYTSYGVSSALVSFAKPLRHLEQLVNQWQLLKFFNRESGSPINSSLLLQGYAIDDFNTIIKTKSSRSPITLENFYKNVIEPKKRLLQYIYKKSKAQWTIKWLKQSHGIIPREYDVSHVGSLSTSYQSDLFPELTKDAFIFLKCVVTESTSSPNLASAYCMELGIDAEILLLPGSSVSVGDRLVCSSIVYLNEIEGRLILMQ